MTAERASRTTNDAPTLEAVLADPAVERALVDLLHDLPEWAARLKALGNLLAFAEHLLADRESLTYLLSGLKEDWPPVTFDRETLAALLRLLDKAPRLVALLDKIEPMVEFAVALAEDQESQRYLYESVQSYVAPFKEKAAEAKALVDAIRRRAQEDRTPVGVFGLMKLLKEPVVQELLITLRAAASVLGERKGHGRS
ncbi:MAG: hypothetical protein HSCHL_1662 [Hydrogenibacillus schlegelii]|uniref:DUF1641 domain-containing protein n=2 Tax=Hydrogenibacillus schlegelii TaxID=1484 RepID=A0A2T5GBM9_HYDSH|nr:hypothetical protein [Hydrogenibacillus schlegelii]PTQ53597.1 MAG: hypothetical protein HSCHL_1662 [Hydrogenibacillus schlegelii]